MLHYIILFIEVISIAQLSYQLKCPYTQWQNPRVLTPTALNALSAKSILADLGVKDYLAEQHTNFNIANYPTPETGINAKTMESLLNSFRSNDIKKDFFPNICDRHEKYNNVYEYYLGDIQSDDLECAGLSTLLCLNDTNNFYYRTYDGACNNFMHPGYGMAKTRYSRMLRPKYGDGKYTPSKSSNGNALPNARILSLSLYGEETLSDNFRTLITMQFGQFVAHDISLFQRPDVPDDCCASVGHKMCYPILLHPFGPIAMTSGKTCLSFSRSLSDKDLSYPPSRLPYAEKISTTTAYLDLSSVYGNSLEENVKVRQYKGGLLKTSSYNNKPFLPLQNNLIDKCPANNNYCYSIPDNRNQFTPIIAVIQTIFVREHNRLANILAQMNPQYSDEKIFQLARKINIAQYQKITYYDFLPLILGKEYCFANRITYSVSPYDYVNDYDQSWDPAPLAEYAAVAFRYLHQTIPGWFSLVSPERNNNQTLRLSDYFDNEGTPDLLKDGNNIDSLIRGLVTQLQKNADSNVDREIKHHFDRRPFEEFGTDLKAIDIQRGRDFGLASYNDYREHCGLTRAQHWDDLLSEIPAEKINLLKKFYVTPNDVDLSIGGSYERHSPGSLLGPTFQCIIGKQFLKTRVADRFFFEHEDINSGFTREQLDNIKKVSFASILCANGNNMQCMQPNVFIFPNHQNNLVSCEALPQLDLKLWQDNEDY